MVCSSHRISTEFFVVSAEDGNLTRFGDNTLSYDAANKWVGGSSNSTFGTAATREYWYDQSGLSLETTTTGDNIVFLRSPGGRLLSRWFSPVLVNYGTNRLGSVTALMGTDQSLQHTYNYRPYGEINYQTGSRYNPYRYTGSYHDSQTALYQMGAW